MKIAILGKTGMLGSMVFDVFSKTDYEITATDRSILDAQNTCSVQIEKILNNCDYAINCIGIIKPYIHDDNSYEVTRAVEVNALFPHKLAAAAEKNGTKVIQIATDCVWDGKKGRYVESDKHNALDVYGKTKSLGEAVSPNVLNLRCSIIGPEKKGMLSLLEWFLNQGENASVNGFKNHYWNGVTTEAFAQICLGIIQNDIWFSGLQHVVPADIVTKAQMLKDFAEVFNRQDINITDFDAEESIDRSIETLNKEKNLLLWKNSGLKDILSVKEMLWRLKH